MDLLNLIFLVFAESYKLRYESLLINSEYPPSYELYVTIYTS